MGTKNGYISERPLIKEITEAKYERVIKNAPWGRRTERINNLELSPRLQCALHTHPAFTMANGFTIGDWAYLKVINPDLSVKYVRINKYKVNSKYHHRKSYSYAMIAAERLFKWLKSGDVLYWRNTECRNEGLHEDGYKDGVNYNEGEYQLRTNSFSRWSSSITREDIRKRLDELDLSTAMTVMIDKNVPTLELADNLLEVEKNIVRYKLRKILLSKLSQYNQLAREAHRRVLNLYVNPPKELKASGNRSIGRILNELAKYEVPKFLVSMNRLFEAFDAPKGMEIGHGINQWTRLRVSNLMGVDNHLFDLKVVEWGVIYK